MKQLSADFDIGEEHALYILWVTELLVLDSLANGEIHLQRITFYDGNTGRVVHTRMSEWEKAVMSACHLR